MSVVNSLKCIFSQPTIQKRSNAFTHSGWKKKKKKKESRGSFFPARKKNISLNFRWSRGELNFKSSKTLKRRLIRWRCRKILFPAGYAFNLWLRVTSLKGNNKIDLEQWLSFFKILRFFPGTDFMIRAYAAEKFVNGAYFSFLSMLVRREIQNSHHNCCYCCCCGGCYFSCRCCDIFFLALYFFQTFWMVRLFLKIDKYASSSIALSIQLTWF